MEAMLYVNPTSEGCKHVVVVPGVYLSIQDPRWALAHLPSRFQDLAKTILHPPRQGSERVRFPRFEWWGLIG